MTNPVESLCSRWGMSLSDISTVSNIPPAKLRAWRAGNHDIVESAGMIKVGELNAYLSDCEEAGADDPASWLERYLVKGYSVRGLDLYCEGERTALMQIMIGADPVRTLDYAIRDWRARFDSRFEVFDDVDGFPSIRP